MKQKRLQLQKSIAWKSNLPVKLKKFTWKKLLTFLAWFVIPFSCFLVSFVVAEKTQSWWEKEASVNTITEKSSKLTCGWEEEVFGLGTFHKTVKFSHGTHHWWIMIQRNISTTKYYYYFLVVRVSSWFMLNNTLWSFLHICTPLWAVSFWRCELLILIWYRDWQGVHLFKQENCLIEVQQSVLSHNRIYQNHKHEYRVSNGNFIH